MNKMAQFLVFPYFFILNVLDPEQYFIVHNLFIPKKYNGCPPLRLIRQCFAISAARILVVV